MKHIFRLVLCVALVVPCLASGRDVLTVGDTPFDGPTDSGIEFPSVAEDQTRVTSNVGYTPDPVDPTMGGGVAEPCKSGTKYPHQRCLRAAENNQYYCTTDNAAGRTCGILYEGTKVAKCQTCV